MYSLTPNADLAETLDVYLNEDTCAGSIWFEGGRWEACDDCGESLPGSTSLFAAVETVIERWRSFGGDVDDGVADQWKEREAIQKRGANARALGMSKLDNPYYQPENMPTQTGETLEEWSAKATAWEVGFTIKGMMRW